MLLTSLLESLGFCQGVNVSTDKHTHTLDLIFFYGVNVENLSL